MKSAPKASKKPAKAQTNIVKKQPVASQNNIKNQNKLFLVLSIVLTILLLTIIITINVATYSYGLHNSDKKTAIIMLVGNGLLLVPFGFIFHFMCQEIKSFKKLKKDKKSS